MTLKEKKNQEFQWTKQGKLCNKPSQKARLPIWCCATVQYDIICKPSATEAYLKLSSNSRTPRLSIFITALCF